MKKLLLAFLLPLSISSFAQTFVSIASDIQGDDFYLDAKELSYYFNSTEDTLFVKIEHFDSRNPDFGFALALDTNLDPTDGFLMAQGSIKNQSPNISMNYDLAFYAYQNGFFPTVYTEAYGSDGMPTNTPFGFDTTNSHYSIFSIPLTSIGGNADLNLVSFTGSFDVSPVGAGPTDAMPNHTFAVLKASSIGIGEYAYKAPAVYPNPSNGYVTIEANENIKHLVLTDLNGKTIQKIDLEKRSGFNTESLAKGTYLLKSEENKIPITKILVQP